MGPDIKKRNKIFFFVFSLIQLTAYFARLTADGLRASTMAGCKPAESLLAEREQERECGAGVSQNVGLERVDTCALRFYWLLCCCVGSALGATCCWLPLLHLMEARLEFISPAAGCIIALARNCNR